MLHNSRAFATLLPHFAIPLQDNDTIPQINAQTFPPELFSADLYVCVCYLVFLAPPIYLFCFCVLCSTADSNAMVTVVFYPLQTLLFAKSNV